MGATTVRIPETAARPARTKRNTIRATGMRRDTALTEYQSPGAAPDVPFLG